MQLYIVLAIMAFMIIGFFLNKWPFGLTAMTCCALLVLTGVYDLTTAFSGLVSQNVILVAGMFVVCGAFGKTGLLVSIRKKMTALKSSRGYLLLILMTLLIIAFAQFLPTTGVMTIMIMFLMSLDDTGDITPSRMLIPVLGLVSIWGTKLPIGMGAASYANLNARYEGLGATPEQLLGVFDRFKVCIIPCLALTVYSLLAYKLMVNRPIDTDKLKDFKDKEALPKRDETIIYIVFVVVMGSLFFNNQLGQIMYLVPVLGVLVLAYTKAMPLNEIKMTLSSDSVWMLGGALMMAQALGDTGAGDAIGNGILTLMGGKPNGILVLFVFAIVTTVMTTFMSNSATTNILIPVAASTALAAGWDPRGVVLIVSFCSGVAIAFPSGSPACGIAYGAGNYKIGETLKFTLPFIVIAIITIVFSANLFFPIYG